ncbi:hypothetical protein [Streptomyces lunaelactis]|uniref:hypothetical protein n=1 Tax=Streptomyces lunaelactis TaxID=1535768 RepID=UPI00359F1872
MHGYKVALEDNTNGADKPVWYSGSEVAPDLSFPKVQERLENIAPQLTDQPGRRRTNPWHQATAATERIPHHLDQADDEASQAHLATLGEALDAFPLLAPQPLSQPPGPMIGHAHHSNECQGHAPMTSPSGPQ